MKKMLSLLIFASLLLVACADKGTNEVEAEKVNAENNNNVAINENEEKEADLTVVEQIKKDHPHYADTIELYERAITEAWTMEKLETEGLAFEYEDPSGSLSEDYLFQVIELEDIPAFLVTASFINDLPYIHEIYTVEKGKAKRQFVDGIRTHLSIYQDGTIVESYGNRFINLFSVNKDGEVVEDEVFEFDGNNYLSEKQSLTEAELQAMFEALRENVGELEIDFIPFIDEDKEVGQTDGALSLSEMTAIMETSYEKLNEYLLQAHQVNDMFERYHSYDEAETIWQQGLDPSSAFYQEIEAWIAPQVEDLVTKDGLEAFINALFSRYYKTVAPDSFTQPTGEFEILAQTDDSFKLEQKKTIPAQEIGGSSYLDVFHVTYEKEDGTWKFADLETIVWDQEIED